MTVHDDDKRKVVHATICASSADPLRSFCMGHGVTVTAFIDGLGHVLADMQHLTLEELGAESPALAAALVLARQVDASRRNREPRSNLLA